MFKVIILFLLAIFWDFVIGAQIDLPLYIPKCSLSDPKFNECLVKAANEAIPILAKGDPSHNISPLSPIAYTEAVGEAVGFKFVVYDVYTDSWKNLLLTNAIMDFENGKASFEGAYEKLQFTAENYTITEGKILGIPVYGHGKQNYTVVGVKVVFQGNLSFYRKGDDEYVDYYDSKADVSVQGGSFYFENMKSPEKSDVNAYINENWESFFNQMKPVFDIYADLIINSQIKVILNTVPFRKVFLP